MKTTLPIEIANIIGLRPFRSTWTEAPTKVFVRVFVMRVNHDAGVVVTALHVNSQTGGATTSSAEFHETKESKITPELIEGLVRDCTSSLLI